jgi:hypothetical protein
MNRGKIMQPRQPRYSKEQHARLGTEIYERQVRPEVQAGNEGKIVAIDVDSGDFELAQDTLTATERLLARLPEAQIWIVRIGHAGVHRFGPRSATRAK